MVGEMPGDREDLAGHVFVGPAGRELDAALESLILRAMAKDPAQRHGSAAAFKYELNTVMDMLDMGRRRARGSGVVPTENARERAGMGRC